MIDVKTQADIVASSGKRARLHGTIVRPKMARGPGNGWQATGLELGDGTVLWVDYGKTLPDGWTDGAAVTVIGIPWEDAPPDRMQSARGPHLTDWESPQPR